MSNILENFYVKVLFGVLLAFLGVAGGIYVGFALVDRSGDPTATPMGDMPDEQGHRYLVFDVGDLFPEENCRLGDGSQANFAQLLKGQKSILIFSSFGCEPCRRLLRSWKEGVRPKLRSDVQVIVCAPYRMDAAVPEEYRDLLEGTQLVYFDERYFADYYDLTTFPTIVAVDGSGFVHHIQYGFGGAVDYEIMDHYTYDR